MKKNVKFLHGLFIILILISCHSPHKMTGQEGKARSEASHVNGMKADTTAH